jgi:putative ABC transport system permease protein
MVYFPAPSAASGWSLMTVVVRSAAPPAQLTPSVRGVLRSIDPSIPFYNVATAEELLETSMGPRRFVMSLLVGFAAVAVILACVGLFGVMAYLVSQRAREIGIRLALGARPTDVRRSVVGRALALASAGAALGIASAYWLSPVMESFLFEVRVVDPVAFVGAPMLLVAVALFASYLPARRAMRVNPITALREE